MESPLQSFSDTVADWASQPVLTTTPEAYEAARISLIDTLACMIVGAREQQPTAAREALLFGQEHGPVLAIGGNEKLSLLGATFLNGVRAHAIDFDDYEFPASTHPSAALFAALFSLAQVLPLSLNQICNAWIVGYETIVWMGRALGFGHYDKGWHASATLDPIGTAAAASRALGLTQQQMSNAMALATSSSSGLKRQFGSDTKAFHIGLAAENGLRAALLAQADATANTQIWDAPQGFMDLYGAAGSVPFAEMMQTMALGHAVRIFPVARKLWPSCSYTHRAILGAERLHRDVPNDDPIIGIQVRLPEPFYRVACFDVPQNEAEARFSVSYCTVVGLLTGHVTPEDFHPHRFNQPDRQRLAQLVEIDAYDLPPGDPGEFGPTTVETITVTLRSGRTLQTETCDVPAVTLPITREELGRKVTDCGASCDLVDTCLALDGETILSETGLLDARQAV
ncbi:MAG: 2-methylcitrate dehydratase [Rhodospirillaceae bacterium]|jgi:2-methylcitrate dehydratase PrpD|uniref:MmgE/PrpD family protein n=1 Tax=Hwanghaeella sp. 1Z406 TaxID=3402811 RepID=UPI000C4A6814|nr:2-methylcitrate dehydratase [Rhodospirillales bacterium]MAX47178.1 2-methylcitrate dehydratase [Rhodospirillaceae bacterium]|tara:strand:+ start:18111 stop:19475 length:1365 start_codon:yes stop_codon:yes gene_type:complete